jgi:hypothetical protein
MAWNIKGTMIEFCSCRVLCPCWLGPDTKPDQCCVAERAAFHR